MELVSMLAAILFLTLYVIGALIYEYFYEIRYLHLRAFQKLTTIIGTRQNIQDDPTGHKEQ